MGAGWEIYPAGHLLWGLAVLVVLVVGYACLHHIAKRLDEAVVELARIHHALASKENLEPDPEPAPAERKAFGVVSPEVAARRAARRAEREGSK